MRRVFTKHSRKYFHCSIEAQKILHVQKKMPFENSSKAFASCLVGCFIANEGISQKYSPLSLAFYFAAITLVFWKWSLAWTPTQTLEYEFINAHLWLFSIQHSFRASKSQSLSWMTFFSPAFNAFAYHQSYSGSKRRTKRGKSSD